MKNIAGKTILITGASSGIGRSFAYQCAEQWAHLIITARTGSVLEEIAKDIRDKHAVSVEVIVGDLSKPGTPQMIYDEVIKRGLSVDILINNAGFGKWGKFLSPTLELYREMLQIDITAVTEMSYLFLPTLLEKKSWGMINIASTGAFQPCPYIAVYCAAKAYVLSFSEALAWECLWSGVTITTLCPGNTETWFQKTANADTAGMGVASSDAVAKIGLDAFLSGRQTIVAGIGNALQTILPRILPRTAIVRIVRNMMRDRAGK